VGALGIRGSVELAPRIFGGGQEREHRSGTQNVAAIVGLAAAIDALTEAGQAAVDQVRRRRDLLAGLIARSVPGAVLTAPSAPKVAGHCHFRFPGVEAEALVFLLDERGVCASAGAACASGAVEPSPILLAMGVDKEEAASGLRLTLGPGTTDEDVRVAAEAVAEAVGQLRGA
jgi:cysteine desulfurase